MSDSESTPKWLRRVQEQSWEPEVLISGIVLLILTRVPEAIDQLSMFLKTQSLWIFYSSNLAHNLSAFMKLAIYWLIFGLAIHLILRSVWVSLVGLSYVFPKGINNDRLNYKGAFQKTIENIPSFPKQIEKLERACSMAYAITFLMFMITIGFFIAISSIGLILVIWMAVDYENFMTVLNKVDTYLNVVFALLAIPYIIDFLTVGALKRMPYINRIYRPIYVFLGAITLAPIYRPVYYGLVSNIKKRWVIIALVGYCMISAYFYPKILSDDFGSHEMVYKTVGTSSYVGYYEDNGKDNISRWAHIPTDQVDGQSLRLFVVHSSGLEDSIRVSCSAMDFDSVGQGVSEIDMACMSLFYRVAIDEDTLPETRWWFRDDDQFNQVGLITWLDLSAYPAGIHELHVLHHHKSGPREVARIPFFKDEDVRKTNIAQENDSIVLPPAQIN